MSSAYEIEVGNETSRQLGNYLRRLRESHDLRLSDLSQTTKMTISHLSCVETGKTEPRFETVARALAAYQLRAHLVIDEEEPRALPARLYEIGDVVYLPDRARSNCIGVVTGYRLCREQEEWHYWVENKRRTMTAYADEMRVATEEQVGMFAGLLREVHVV